jgi:hypothetical protein
MQGMLAATSRIILAAASRIISLHAYSILVANSMDSSQCLHKSAVPQHPINVN